jgi:hypothetical protein
VEVIGAAVGAVEQLAGREVPPLDERVVGHAPELLLPVRVHVLHDRDELLPVRREVGGNAAGQ